MVDRIIYHPVNQGKGAALRSGFAAATGDIHSRAGRRSRIQPEDYPAAFGAAYVRQGGRGSWLPVHGRATTSRPFFLAHGWQQIFDAALQHVHQH